MRLGALPSLALALSLLTCCPPLARARDDKSASLSFEVGPAGRPLAAWRGSPQGFAPALSLDSVVVHGGRYSGRIQRDSTTEGEFSAFALEIPVDFVGDTLAVTGWVKYENVTGFVGLWQRQDPQGPFENMEDRGLKGTADWTELRVVLPLERKAKKVTVGALLVGSGTLWVDDLRIEVDGRPLAEAPDRPKTPLDTDHEFDAGSKIDVESLTRVQTTNLALLGKVWGFLKYHHPAVVAGKHHWDYDLFRVLPSVLRARDAAEGRNAITAWVASLGPTPPCEPCVQAPRNTPLLPRLSWLGDRKVLGAGLSDQLKEIYARRPSVDEQFYVGLDPGIGNPDFANELDYAAPGAPDPGYRLLALFRYWNIIEYWAPDRDLIGENWDAVLREFLPRLVAADSKDDYAAAMMALIARVHDTHANLWSSLDVRPPRGGGRVPVRTRFIEGRAVVTGFTHATLGPASGLLIGDVIRAIDHVPVETLISRWRPMYAASNEPTRLRDMGETLTKGEVGPVSITVTRGGREIEVAANRVPSASLDLMSGWTHDLPGPAFRRLSEDIAYLKLSAVKADDVPTYLQNAAGARCLVIDIRNYPSEFVVFALGQHLVRDSTAFVTFTVGDTRNPGAFHWGETLSLIPAEPYFGGRVAILVDEVTQSSAEYTSMAFRSRPGALVVGSTTAGADGNVSRIPLPGGLRTMISGIGVFYPDHRPTQRVGIIPNVTVRPTLEGIRARRDEVLERAIQEVLGRQVTEPERGAMRQDERPKP